MSSSDEQKSQGIKWVPLAEAPFKLRFGWDLPEGADENDLENDSQYLVSFGWARVRWYRESLFIQCYNSDNIVCATIPIGMIAYLGMDAPLTGAELAAQGKIVNWKRTRDAFETAVRLAVVEGQLRLRARKSLDGTFTDVPPSAVPELKLTNWSKGWGEYSTSERLFDIQASLLRPQEAGHDHTFSSRLLMTIDPMALRRIQTDYRTTSTSEAQKPVSATLESTQSKRLRGNRANTKERKPPHRPPGRGYQKADEPLVDEMRSLLMQGRATSPTQAAASLVSRAEGRNTTDASKIRRLVARLKERCPEFF